jgi:hypothetical protein
MVWKKHILDIDEIILSIKKKLSRLLKRSNFLAFSTEATFLEYKHVVFRKHTVVFRSREIGDRFCTKHRKK